MILKLVKVALFIKCHISSSEDSVTLIIPQANVNYISTVIRPDLRQFTVTSHPSQSRLAGHRQHQRHGMCTTDLTTALVLQATVSVLHRGWLYEAPQSVPTLNKPNNPNRGQEVLAEIAARFITRLFTCLDYAPAADYAPSADHGHA